MKSLTGETFKDFIPFGVVIVSVALSWGSLKADVGLIRQAQELDRETAKDVNMEIRELRVSQTTMNLELKRLATIIDEAQRRGLLVMATQKKTSLATATPILTALEQGQREEVSIAQARPVEQSNSPTPTPTQVPTPTQIPTPTSTPTPVQSVLCVIGVCLGRN